MWRAASPLRGVYVRLNRVTDKDNVAKGMMTQLPTTDIWHLTLRLPASYCGSYTMVEIPPETPDETVLQLGSRFASLCGCIFLTWRASVPPATAPARHSAGITLSC